MKAKITTQDQWLSPEFQVRCRDCSRKMDEFIFESLAEEFTPNQVSTALIATATSFMAAGRPDGMTLQEAIDRMIVTVKFYAKQFEIMEKQDAEEAHSQNKNVN